jgi:SPP1 gp7 family putative phage head morphogenesis protein
MATDFLSSKFSNLPVGETTTLERRRAQLQADRINRINRQGDIFVRQYVNAIRRAALAALRQGQRVEITDAAIEKIVDELVGLSLVSYFSAAKSFRRAQPTLPDALPHRTVLSLSSFDTDVARIARGFDINVGTLSKRLRTIVAPNVRESLHTVKDRINKELSELSANKVPTRQATKILTDRLEEMGVAPRNSGYVETLVRTHSQLSYNAAQHVELTKDTEIWGYKYVTVGDDRVRPEHEKLDGLTKEKDNPIWNTIWPPNGWNCRCQVLAIYDPEPETRLPRNTVDLVDPSFRFNPGLELGIAS